MDISPNTNSADSTINQHPHPVQLTGFDKFRAEGTQRRDTHLLNTTHRRTPVVVVNLTANPHPSNSIEVRFSQT